jgi:hypothetical protein
MLTDDRDFGLAVARLTQRQRIFMDGLRPQADCGGASSQLQQSRARGCAVPASITSIERRHASSWVELISLRYLKADVTLPGISDR